jgi:hypothetical protein
MDSNDLYEKKETVFLSFFSDTDSFHYSSCLVVDNKFAFTLIMNVTKMFNYVSFGNLKNVAT